jgi:transcriptional repressor NrdR
MRCPFCTNEDTQVKDSRSSEDGLSIRRRRYCSSCHYRFTTYERIHLRDLTVTKKNGEKRPFDRDKIFRSISMAVRKRAVTEEQIELIVNKLVRKFEVLPDTEIPTSIIGEEIMNELEKLDQVAYVRFASVYKDFSDPEDFKEFINQLGDDNTK